MIYREFSITILFLFFVNFCMGQVKGKIDCDNESNCQRVFVENFSSTGNLNGWNYPSKKNVKIIKNVGLYMQNKINGDAFCASLYYPINISKDFSIETIINYKSGGTQSQGLIWGFKDWDN